MQRRWKWRTLTSLVIAVTGVALTVWVVISLPLLPNIGLPVGYYAKHNIARQEVSRVSGVTIESERLHEDLMLEDSSLYILYHGQPVELRFDWESMPENIDPLLLVDNLPQKIERHLNSGSPNQPLQLTSNARD